MSDLVAINVVFTDLVGSTEMSSRLGPEPAEALRVVHFDLLRSAIEAHGGTEVKNLGDGLMAVFPSLTSSLDGGVAMQQAIEQHNASGNEPLGIRVGISAGDATQEDGDYFGEPVVEAARLCAKCEAGQIITSEFTSMMARRSNHRFEAIGDLELRGVPEPVPSVTVHWDPVAPEAAIAMPDRLRPDMDRLLAGRVEQTDALAQALKAATAGERRITFLAGEPGIGKTRLAAELAVEAHGHGAVVLYGRCDEELSVPYQPWVEALTHLVEHAPDALVERLVERHGPELVLLVPQLRWRFPDMRTSADTDAETERYMQLQAVTAGISMLAEESPVLLVLDDLHWADKQTLTLLRHVFTNVASQASVMVVGTYRDSDLAGGHPLIDSVAALRREPGVELIKIGGLDDQEMVQLVEISAGQALDDAAREMSVQLRHETAGNPFFAHEILRNMVESGDLYLDDEGKWIVKDTFDNLTLPQSVRDVVAQRIARLGEESMKALTAAAVVGREFDLALLSIVTGLDEDDLLDQLEAAVTAGILAEVPGGDERFRFLHTLARTTLSADLSEGRKRRTHRKIAEALETTTGDDPGDRIGELATHWMAAAAPVDEAKAINYARLAGERALRSLAPDEAIRWFTMALDHLDLADEPDDPMHAGLLVELGTAQQHVGDPAYRQTLLDAGTRARRIGDTDLMVGAALANNRGMYSKLGACDEERVAAAEAALDAIGEVPSAERALLLATLFSELEYRSPFDERVAMIEEAITIAREVDDPWVLASVLNRSVMTSAAPHTLELRTQRGAESLAIAQELGDATLEFWARCGLFQTAMGHGDIAGGQEALDHVTASAAEIGRPSFRWVAANLDCCIQYGIGGPAKLEETANAAFALAEEAGEPDAFDFYAAQIMGVRYMQGRALEIIDQVLTAADENPEIPAYRAAAAMMLATEGDHDTARELLQAATAEGFEFRVNGTWALAVLYWGATAGIVGDAEAAEPLYELLAPWSGQLGCAQSILCFTFDGILAPLAAVLGHPDDAEAHFAIAEQITGDGGVLLNESVDHLARARYHAEHGDPTRAEHYARLLLDVSQQYGYAGQERRAQELLDTLAASAD